MYPSQREADLCTPAFQIPIRYGIESVTDDIRDAIPADWLEE